MALVSDTDHEQQDKPMGRLPDKEEAKLSPEQRRAYEETKRVRGQVRGPFAIWLRNAELSETALRLQDMFASRAKLERRLLQLMILVSARMATAQYAWFIHEPHALKLASRPRSSKPSASGAHQSSRAKTNAPFMTLRWNSTPTGRCLRQNTNVGWRCSESRSWSSWSAQSAST